MKKILLITCFILIQSICYVSAEEDKQMYQKGLLLGELDSHLVRLGYEHLGVGLGYNGAVEETDYRNALRSLNAALSELNFLHANYTNLDNIIIVPSYPISAYGTTGNKVQIVTESYPIGKTVYIPYHLSTETIREQFSVQKLPELTEEDLVEESVIYPHQ